MIVWNFNPYAVALLATATLSLVLSALLLTRWSNRDSIILGFALGLFAEWIFFVGFESAVQNIDLKILFAKFSYFGVYFGLPYILLFVVYYFGIRFEKILRGRRVILLWVIPLIVVSLAATNEFHYLIWSDMVTPPDAVFNTLVYNRGPLYWLGIGYIYLVCLTMSVLLFIKIKNSHSTIYRNQALLFFIATIPPWVANILYILRIPSIKYLDLTPFGFFLTGSLLFFGLSRLRLLEIAPVARDMLFDSLTDAIIVLNDNYELVDINTNARQFLKYPEENWIGSSFTEGIVEIPGLLIRLKTKNGFLYETNIGTSRAYEIDGRPVSNGTPRFSGWIITIRDISSRKLAQKVEIERRQFAEALRDVSMVVNSTLDLKEVLERILSSVFEFLPCNMANIALIENGIAHVEIFHGYLSQEEIEWIKAVRFEVNQVPNLRLMVETGKPMFISDTRKVDYFTNPSVLSYMGAPIKVKHEVIGFLNLDSDVADVFNSLEECERLQAFADLAGIAIDNARMFQKMSDSAINDSLTGIKNRRSLLQVAEHEFERSNRYDTPISIIMLDIDKFKQINDTCGHLAGDTVLADVGKALNAFIRKIDTAGRYGGDEFCIILPETDLSEAKTAANRLLEEFHKIKIPSVSYEEYLEASLGVASKNENISNLKELLARADQALYLAKKRGRNRVESLSN